MDRTVHITSVSHFLIEVVKRCGSDPAWKWLDDICSKLEGSFDEELITAAYSGARRRLGETIVRLDCHEETILQKCGLIALKGSGLDGFGRAALLFRGIECVPHSSHVPLVEGIYQGGDNSERQAVLRALCGLPDAGRFLSVAVDACRSNVLPIFQAMTCENPYPFHYFPELSFNQMVIKALFTRTHLGRVVGLDQRITPELVRMAEDYANEQRAAKRSVPEDLALIFDSQRLEA